MHKRETLKIVLITLSVLAVIVINALIFTRPTTDVTQAPLEPDVTEPVPDFSLYADVKEKKRAFYQFLYPEIHKQNNYLLTLRHYVESIYRKVAKGHTLNKMEQEKVAWLASEYRVDTTTSLKVQVEALLVKIDIIPAELVLAQSANESAWGTSRFARQGFNFFGLWCFSPGCGFVPSRRQPGLHHEVAKFSNLSLATYTYMRNLNRHQAYKELRAIRARLRANQLPITGEALAEGLINYSERGAAYVEELQSMIRFNQEYLPQ